MATDAQKKARNAYNARSTKAITLRFYPTDMHLYDHVRGKENMAAYVKRLIAEDMVAEQVADRRDRTLKNRRA